MPVARSVLFPSTAGISVIVKASFFGGGATGWKRTAITCSRFIVTVQPPVPVQAPPQPSNRDPAAAAGARVTLAPSLNVAEQAPPQSIPAGWDETVPLPVAVRMTVKACCVGGMAANVAKTCVSPCMVTVQPPGPLQAPPQPSKRKPLAGLAMSETEVPWSNDAAQICPQLIPAGLDWMAPCPFTAMRSPNCCTGRPASIPPCEVPPSVADVPPSTEGTPVEPLPEEATGPQATRRAQSSMNVRIDPPVGMAMSAPTPRMNSRSGAANTRLEEPFRKAYAQDDQGPRVWANGKVEPMALMD